MAMATGGGGGVKSDINVTPLVDVVLVLLIIFMVVTPMMQRGKDVQLPTASEQEEKGEGPDPLILSITKDKETYVESDAVKDETELLMRLQEAIAIDPRKRLMLKGDASLAYGDVRRVMKVAREAGAKGVALGVEVKKD